VTRWLLRCGLILILSRQSLNLPAAMAQSPAVSSSPVPPAASATAKPQLFNLDLVALDRDGRQVTDLKPEELRLFEDKNELKIQGLFPAFREPLTIGMFFDMSGSRRGDLHFQEEVRLANEFLHSIWNDGDTGFIVTFNDEDYALVQPTKKLGEIVFGLNELPGMPRRGSTALYDALCALKPAKLAAIPGREIYVTFSDFEDNASRNSFEHVVGVLREGRILIFPIILPEEFIDSPKKEERIGRQRAQRIADETGGEALILESPEQLSTIFRRLAADLHSTYRITYDPPLAAAQKKSKRSRIRIETTREHVTLLYPKS
jgi:VWFA-related protein